MKKLLTLITIVGMMFALSGCDLTQAENRDAIDAAKAECMADAECAEWMVNTLDSELSETDTINAINDKLQSIEDRLKALETLTEQEYIHFVVQGWNDFADNADKKLQDIILDGVLREEVAGQEGMFEVTLTFQITDEAVTEFVDFTTSPNSEYTNEEIMAVLEGIHVDLRNYTIKEIIYTTK